MSRVLPLRALDVAVDVHVDDLDLAGDLEQATAALSRDHGGPALQVRVTRESDGWRIDSLLHHALAHDRPVALGQALAAVNLGVVAATPLLALHAAVLTRAGRTLLLPGTSGLGKTTLTAALLQQGWAYVSDEALALDRSSGDLVPYPRALALSAWSRHALGLPDGLPAGGEHLLPPEMIAACLDPRPGPVTDVVLLSRAPHGGPAELAVAPRVAALRELLTRGFTVHHDPGTALLRLGELVQHARCWSLHLGLPGQSARLLSEELGG